MLNHMEREELGAPPIKRRQQCDAHGGKSSCKCDGTQYDIAMTASSAAPKPSQADAITQRRKADHRPDNDEVASTITGRGGRDGMRMCNASAQRRAYPH
jgi:hypothetical protein